MRGAPLVAAWLEDFRYGYTGSLNAGLMAGVASLPMLAFLHAVKYHAREEFRLICFGNVAICSNI
jgi:hypothetical protein